MKTVFDYEKRTTRKELGIFILFTFLVPVLLANGLFALNDEVGIFERVKFGNFVFIPMYLGLLTTMICLPFIIIKRLHDVGKNGWNIFLPLIPLIGVIWFLYLILSSSQKEDNEYGEYRQIK
ncbi:hypothetical protein BWK60_11615 [Flavobacterium covae]|nr:hypothetical protein BWK60_11615 [Flavobacterium covae]